MTSAISNSTGTTTDSGASSQLTSNATHLGKDDFLKLLMTQLQHQDPLNPVDDKAFMGEMAQFSQLEQITNLSQSMTKLNFSTQVANASSLIGRQVTWTGQDGTTATGIADRVSIDGTTVSIGIGTTTIAPSQILTIGPAPKAQAAQPSTSGTTASTDAAGTATLGGGQ